MIRVLAFVSFVIALVLFVKGEHHKYGTTFFVYLGLTLWCLSGIWDRTLAGRRNLPET